MLYLLLILFIIMLIVSYLKLGKDIMQPAVIFCSAYILSIACVIMNIGKWNIVFHLNTFLVLTLGGLEFVLICFTVHKLYTKKKAKEEEEPTKKEETLQAKNNTNIKKYMVVLVCLYNVIVLGLLIYNVLSIAHQFGEYSNFTQALTLFKNNTSYEINAEIPHYMNLLGKPVIIFAYIFLYVFLKNVIKEEGKIHQKIIKNWYYLIPVLTYIFYEFTASNRLTILSLVLGGFTIAVILWNQKNNWSKTVRLRSIGRMVICAICGLILFYFSASVIGRVNSRGPIDYITLYCGGSIECLNRFMQDPPEKSNIVGKESFYYLIKNLDSYGMIELEEKYPIHLEFRNSYGNMIGNVYTAYRRWIYDFGILGMVILQAIMAIFYQLFYEIIKKRSKQGKQIHFLTILYAYMIYPVFLHPIDGYFYLLTIRMAFLTTLVMYLVAYTVLFQLTIKKEENGIKMQIGNKEISIDYSRKRRKEKINEKE